MNQAQLRHLVKTYKERNSHELESIKRGLEEELRVKQDIVRALKEELEKRRGV